MGVYTIPLFSANTEAKAYIEMLNRIHLGEVIPRSNNVNRFLIRIPNPQTSSPFLYEMFGKPLIEASKKYETTELRKSEHRQIGKHFSAPQFDKLADLINHFRQKAH